MWKASPHVSTHKKPSATSGMSELKAKSAVLRQRCLSPKREKPLLDYFYLHGNDFVLLIQWTEAERWRWSGKRIPKVISFDDSQPACLWNDAHTRTTSFFMRGYPFEKSTRHDEKKADTINVGGGKFAVKNSSVCCLSPEDWNRPRNASERELKPIRGFLCCQSLCLIIIVGLERRKANTSFLWGAKLDGVRWWRQCFYYSHRVSL